ncbi:MAG: YihY/virulence factor BrkB family protein [Acidobacteriia bacterium]|nr:YihY/virulence factor BrkB family protein [Terriglobia bacterium]
MSSEPRATVELPPIAVPAATASAAVPAKPARIPVLSHIVPTAKFLMRTEVHTFAFSVAANAILSFFPFMVLLLMVTRRVLHSQMMYDTVVRLLRDYLPTGQDFVIRNLKAMAGARRGVQIFSVVMLLITSTGIFLPLEVALNHVWGFTRNRSYLWNQVVSLLLAIGCSLLALISVALTAGNTLLLQHALGGVAMGVGWRGWLLAHISLIVMKVFAIAASIAIFFLVYWVLPNGKVPVRAVLPAAVITGVCWEAAKYAYVIALPWLNFQEVYGPFSISVTLIFWAFLSGLLLLGGAYLSAAGHTTADR